MGKKHLNLDYENFRSWKWVNPTIDGISFFFFVVKIFLVVCLGHGILFIRY